MPSRCAERSLSRTNRSRSSRYLVLWSYSLIILLKAFFKFLELTKSQIYHHSPSVTVTVSRTFVHPFQITAAMNVIDCKEVEEEVINSMTSVTEEDSDPEIYTEKSICSKSNATSFGLSSTDYNTDEKLTPSLEKISISHAQCQMGAPQTEQNLEQPFIPDVNSPTWYMAQCFNNYWSHYHFVMEWYQRHLQTMELMSNKTSSGASGRHFGFTDYHRLSKGQKLRKSKNRARNRRNMKEKKKLKSQTKLGTSGQKSKDEELSLKVKAVHENETEMEVTDEFMEFFATSLKHKIERDNSKTKCQEKSLEDSCVKFEEDQNIHNLIAPKERPGTRRAAEMKLLYGAGSPMIHGMETSLQMMFDKMNDRHQPKLWPNVPLKILF